MITLAIEKTVSYIFAPLRFIWFIWLLIWFLATGIVAFLFYITIFNLFSGRQKIMATFYVTKWWGRILMGGVGVFMPAEGTHLLDKNKTYVLVSNHLSMVDIPVCMSSCPVPFSFLAKKEVDKMPVVGYLARNMHVYVDRKSEESRKQSLENMRQHLEENSSIHLYVEGTRNKGDELLQRFHKGAFRLAIDTQRPMAVLVIIGSEKALNPRYKFQASPAIAKAIWTEPIETVGMTMEDLPKLEQMVRNRMLEVLTAHDRT
jgi:1-acyl-sn-glycerol-3-phosphate acyltransferase